MDKGKKSLPLHTRIFIGLLVGAVAGFIAKSTVGSDNPTLQSFVTNVAQPIGQVFMRLIFMVVVPLLFSALVLGVNEIGDAKRVGRVGMRALMMTFILSGTAVVLGLLLVNAVRPGEGISETRRAQLVDLYMDSEGAEKNIQQANEAKSAVQTLVEIIPRNPLEEAVRALEGGLLPFMFFALIFGIAMSSVEPEKSQSVRVLLEGIFEISLKIIDFAMRLAPFAVAGLIFSTTAVIGTEALLALGKYVILVLAALAFHLFVSYSIVLYAVARRSPFQFFRQIRTVMLTAFATSSSNATLPTALKSAEEDVNLPRDISSFVLTVGATANQNGTALFEGITVLFLAQLFGIDLSFGQQLVVMGLSILAGIGTAGVPGGSWPMIAVILVKVGVPAESIGLILGIDRILDMSRTVLNVTGDMTIAACVAQLEGEPVGETDVS